MKRTPIRSLLCGCLAAITLLTSLAPAAAAAQTSDPGVYAASLSGLSLGGTSKNLTNTTTAMAVTPQAGIYWFGCYRDAYQALNLQYDKTDSGLVLDPMNFQQNELWVLKPAGGIYFTLAPMSHPDYLIAGQTNDHQLRLKRTNSLDASVQWYAVPDGEHVILINRKTGLAMDTAHGSSTTGNRVLNYTRNGFRDAQSWSMIRVSDSTSRIASGSRTTISDGAYAILASSNTSKAVNDQYASKAGNGTAGVVLDTYNAEANEVWIFTHRGNQRYTISPSHCPNICLNVWSASPKAGNQLTLYNYQAGDECSLWEIYRDGSTYSFRNVKTGLWLNLWGNTQVDGNKIVGYHYDGSAAMKWKLQSPSSGSSGGSSSSSGLASSNLGRVSFIKQNPSTCKATAAAMAVNLIMGRNAYSTRSMIASGVLCKNLNGNTYRGSDGAVYRTTYKTDSYVGSLSEVARAVESAVSSGLPIVVAVHKNGGTRHHWIVLVGKDSSGRYLVVDPGRSGSGSMASNTKTMNALGYSFGLTDYSTTHYGYISFART